ncbi:MAG: hypothetical protein QOC91_1476 [Solirubrobacteraceae bacterium]|nr:hypothetical protein [Solirubrobacteraceae bacterium]
MRRDASDCFRRAWRVRGRARLWLAMVPMGRGSLLMERKMLRGVKQRAESLACPSR